MPARAARLRNRALRTSSSSAFGAPRRLRHGCGAAALAHPGVGRGCLHRAQERVAHLREQSARADGRRRNPARGRTDRYERRELRRNFGADHLGIEPAQQAGSQHLRQAAETAPPSQRPKAHRQRLKRRGQRDVQADRAARTVARQRACSASTSSRAIAGPTTITEVALIRPRCDQIADRAVDAGADAVIVGAQPDAARRLRRRSFGGGPVRAVASAGSASARFTLCSATK